MLTYHSLIKQIPESSAVQYAAKSFLRDLHYTCNETELQGDTILLRLDEEILPECYRIRCVSEGIEISASGDLGLIYGIYHISKYILGVQEFWFWNEQIFDRQDGYEIPENYSYESTPYPVRFRGWFVNDEVLIDDWKIDGNRELPWELVFETLLRCGGNMTIPGTDENAHIYCKIASDMGLWITHHHAEPLGAQMFARAYPDLEASYDKYPELFENLWREGIEQQLGYRVLWNLGFRGQGDRPFWADDPTYATPAARGRLMSDLIKKQYDLVRSYDPQAICCSNLYGETMELYQQGYLEIPEDVILIWADNGFGKMVSRRQGDHNPRVYALPPKDHTGKHGIYYHVSFYDLQAAAQMTMLPNAPEFVETELQTVQELGVTDYWIINCSNVKPHAYYLDLIARIWRGGETVDFTASYCRETYGAEAGGVMEALYRMWPKVSPSYGPNADDHAGEQFANHGARVLVSAQIAGCDPADPERTAAAREWKWFSDKETLREQTTDYLQIIEPALTQYEQYLTKCREAEDQLSLPRRVQAEDTLIWQVEYLYYSYLGALHSCRAILTISDPLEAFYEAGLAMQAFQTGYEMMRSHEHGVFVGFFANDCEADIRQSGYVLKGLMSFLRIRADGPHFYKWQRLFQDGAGGDRVLLILRTKKHLTDEELWRLMNEKRK